MLAVWKEWNEDSPQKAYEKGIVMSGVSAGAIAGLKGIMILSLMNLI